MYSETPKSITNFLRFLCAAVFLVLKGDSPDCCCVLLMGKTKE